MMKLMIGLTKNVTILNLHQKYGILQVIFVKHVEAQKYYSDMGVHN